MTIHLNYYRNSNTLEFYDNSGFFLEFYTNITTIEIVRYFEFSNSFSSDIL